MSGISFGQNALVIPPTIETSTINLTLQEGVTQFYPGVNTSTLGANGALLGPTLIMSTGDNMNITVDNQLLDTTTIHWHGMHVSPEDDGGPHSIILPGTTWNPQFTVMDKAGLNWYHPHLHEKTGEHVSKGIAGLVIVRDTEEASMGIPITYGVDEFPIIMQTKGFNASGQILFHTNLDTSVMVNGTVDAFVDFPSQVVRLRVLNAASQRVMEIGFSDNRTFSIIGTDGGIFMAPVNKTRYRIAPGQRVDILLDLTTSLGQNFQLMNFASELPNAVYGSAQPGMAPFMTSSLPGYTSNPLNGANYAMLDINVIAQTASPITTIPATLASFTVLTEASATVTRDLTFSSAGGGMGNLSGPFLIDGSTFDMSVINHTVQLDDIEIWTLTNQTPIAHPFHIHDVQFFILDINGSTPPAELQGFNDVVLVPGGMGNVRFIAQFSDHANNTIPYMYHCHMLPHEDEGMMGQFIVTSPTAEIVVNELNGIQIYPNPSVDQVNIQFDDYQGEIQITNVAGKIIHTSKATINSTLTINLDSGVYFLIANDGTTQQFIIQ